MFGMQVPTVAGIYSHRYALNLAMIELGRVRNASKNRQVRLRTLCLELYDGRMEENSEAVKFKSIVIC